jgi:hypothetical protein
MIISVEEFEKYNGVQDDDRGFLVSLIRAAEEVAADYLGYAPEYQLRRETHDGTGAEYLPVRARPVRAAAYVAIAGAAVPLERVEFTDDRLYLRGGLFPRGRRNVEVRYTAGYQFERAPAVLSGGAAAGAGADVLSGGAAAGGGADGALCGGDAATYSGQPAYLIKNVVLRIASLMLTETGQNIGITSKSFGDSGTRAYLNNTEYAKYLLPIARYKLLVV